MIKIDRVIINSDGEAAPPGAAVAKYGIVIHVAFLRKDGWVLAADAKHELVAFGIWKDEWTHFSHDGLEWKPINEYFEKE